RDPAVRVTIVAELGEMVKNEKGSYPLLQNGSNQRYQGKQSHARLVVFERSAFDLSQFGGTPTVVKYSVRERYLWQLISPDTEDTLYKQEHGPLRAHVA